MVGPPTYTGKHLGLVNVPFLSGFVEAGYYVVEDGLEGFEGSWFGWMRVRKFDCMCVRHLMPQEVVTMIMGEVDEVLR